MELDVVRRLLLVVVVVVLTALMVVISSTEGKQHSSKASSTRGGGVEAEEDEEEEEEEEEEGCRALHSPHEEDVWESGGAMCDATPSFHRRSAAFHPMVEWPCPSRPNVLLLSLSYDVPRISLLLLLFLLECGVLWVQGSTGGGGGGRTFESHLPCLAGPASSSSQQDAVATLLREDGFHCPFASPLPSTVFFSSLHFDALFTISSSAFFSSCFDGKDHLVWRSNVPGRESTVYLDGRDVLAATLVEGNAAQEEENDGDDDDDEGPDEEERTRW